MDSLSNIKITWDIITVNMFIEICLLDIKDYDDIDTYYFRIIAIILDVEDSVIENIPYDDFVRLREEFETVFNKLPTKYSDNITIRDNLSFNLIPFIKMSIGEFIDLENYCQESYIINLKKILSVIYRRLIPSDDILVSRKFEPYSDYVEIREHLFDDVLIKEVYGSLLAYFKFRDSLYKTFEGLFNMNTEEEVEEDLTGLSRAERLEVQKEIDKEKKIKVWGWDLFLYKLANNDPIKIEEATNMPLVQALNVLSMKKELNLE
jgi:hypothetical protein